MSYHKDPGVNQKIIELLDELCQHERDTGRENTFILIPHNPYEKIVIAQNGKPLPPDRCTAHMADQVYCGAFSDRKSKLMEKSE